MHSGRRRIRDCGLSRSAAGLNTDWQATSSTHFNLDLQHSQRRLKGDTYGIVVGSDVPLPREISGSTKLSADGGGFRYVIDSASAGAVQGLPGGWTAHLNGAVTRTRFNYYDSVLFFDDAAGNVRYGDFTTDSRTTTRAAQLIVSGRVRTGLVDHDLAFGLYYARTEQDRGLTSKGSDSGFIISPGGNLYTGLIFSHDLRRGSQPLARLPV